MVLSKMPAISDLCWYEAAFFVEEDSDCADEWSDLIQYCEYGDGSNEGTVEAKKCDKFAEENMSIFEAWGIETVVLAKTDRTA